MKNRPGSPDPNCLLCLGVGSVSVRIPEIHGARIIKECGCTLSLGELLKDDSSDFVVVEGDEGCLAKTVMLTNPDYVMDELPTWENDSADVNPINILFGDHE
jgi:hypothetical protein